MAPFVLCFFVEIRLVYINTVASSFFTLSFGGIVYKKENGCF